MRILGVLAATVMLAVTAPALAAGFTVDVNQGNVQPLPIAIPDFVSASKGAIDPAETAAIQGIAKVVRADLERSGLFKPLDPKSYIEQISNINLAPSFKDWRVITAQGLVTGQAAMQPDGRLRVDFRLWDVYGESQMLGLQYFTQPVNWRRIISNAPSAWACRSFFPASIPSTARHGYLRRGCKTRTGGGSTMSWKRSVIRFAIMTRMGRSGRGRIIRAATRPMARFAGCTSSRPRSWNWSAS